MKAEILKHLFEFQMVGRHIRVYLDDIGFFFLRKLLRSGHQLAKGLAVVQIAHRPAAGIQNRLADNWHFTNQKSNTPLDLPIRTAAENRAPCPCGFLLCPQDALGKMPLRMALNKRFVFRKVRFVDILYHICISIDSIII